MTRVDLSPDVTLFAWAEAAGKPVFAPVGPTRFCCPAGWRVLHSAELVAEGDVFWHPEILAMGIRRQFQWCPVIVLTEANGGHVADRVVIRREAADAADLSWQPAAMEAPR